MKGRKTIIGILVACFLLAAGYNMYDFIKNNAALDKTRQSALNEEETEETAEKHLKVKAVEAIEKYYKVKIDGDNLEFNIEHNTMEKQLERIEKMISELSMRKGGSGATLDYLEEEKKRVKFGTIDLFAKAHEGENIETYAVSFDDETKEILQVTCIKRKVLKKLKPIDFISAKQSMKRAEEFMAENDI